MSKGRRQPSESKHVLTFEVERSQRKFSILLWESFFFLAYILNSDMPYSISIYFVKVTFPGGSKDTVGKDF